MITTLVVILLVLALLVASVLAIPAVAIGWVAYILTFGDVIIWTAVILLIVRHLEKKKAKGA